MDAVASLQLVSTVLLNAGFAWMIGLLCARFWLRHSDIENHHHVHVALQRSGVVAATLCLIFSIAALWVAAAVMSGKPTGGSKQYAGTHADKNCLWPDWLDWIGLADFKCFVFYSLG